MEFVEIFLEAVEVSVWVGIALAASLLIGTAVAAVFMYLLKTGILVFKKNVIDYNKDDDLDAAAEEEELQLMEEDAVVSKQDKKEKLLV